MLINHQNFIKKYEKGNLNTSNVNVNHPKKRC